MLDGFKLNASASEDIIQKYSNSLPKALIDIWKNLGLGTFMDGDLKIVNPDEYDEVLRIPILKAMCYPYYCHCIWRYNYMGKK